LETAIGVFFQVLSGFGQEISELSPDEKSEGSRSLVLLLDRILATRNSAKDLSGENKVVRERGNIFLKISGGEGFIEDR
jgi:hypothetical protein